MANSFEERYVEAIENFWSTIRTDKADFLTICNMDGLETPSRKQTLLRDGGSAGFESWSGGSQTPTNLTAVGAAAVTPTSFKKQHTVTKYDLEDNPDLLAELSVRMALQATEKLRSMVWAVAAAASTADHPVFSGKKVADSFTTPVSQTNKATAALSQTALSAARANRRNYKNQDGDYLALRRQMLVCSPALETTARQLVESSKQPNSATNAGESSLDNTFQPGLDGGLAGVLVVPHFTDVNDWALFSADEMQKAITLWLRSPIEFILTADPNTLAVNMHCAFRASAFWHAECDQRVYFSSVT